MISQIVSVGIYLFACFHQVIPSTPASPNGQFYHPPWHLFNLRINGGKIEVLWTKNGQEALEIQVDRGTGTFALLAIDTRPDSIDAEPLPAAAAKWSYRAIYTENAQRIGQWSNVAEITVAG